MMVRILAVLGGLVIVLGLISFFTMRPAPQPGEEKLAGCGQVDPELVAIDREKAEIAKVFELVKRHAPIDQPRTDIKLYEGALFESVIPWDAHILEVTLTDFGAPRVTIDYYNLEGRTVVTYFESGRVDKMFREHNCNWALLNEDGEIRQLDMQNKES
ncbi:hypothetical protein [Paenibacillus sp. 1P07SE]|uniref:hypothetical protein n=1 Tax=Paenibacillus sp. 1P07SE TaxID=3132209 RepID=UPI0039A568CE